jgi:phospholipase C
VAAGLAGGAAFGASAFSNSLISRALAAPPRCGSLKDVEHIVILIQENRSFDHYFGSYRGVAGFADPNVLALGDGSGLSIFAQPGYPGGFVCHDVFDHTSTLRLIERRFGATVPNLTKWRRCVTGDMTSAFNFATVDSSVPSLPQPSATDSRVTMSSCATSAPVSFLTDSDNCLQDLEEEFVAAYPVTVNSAPPPQEPGTAPTPSGPVACRA